MRESSVERSQFKILYRVFWLRVVDLEALSPDSDSETLLGHLAALLAGVSLLFTAPTILIGGPMSEPDLWTFEHLLFATTLTAVGVLAVLSWDSSLPDRRDLLVLGPLPIRIHTIFAAKLSALGGVLGFSVIALSFSSGLIWPILFSASGSGVLGLARSFISYWAVTAVAAAFVFCSVFCLQAMAALLLPRQLFLRLSSLLQISAFTVLFGAYLLEPSLESISALTAPANQRYLDVLPSYWFLGLFQQLNGSMKPAFAPLASRACYALISALILAVVLLLLSWRLKLRRVVEEPDIVGAATGWRRLKSGDPIPEAIIQFSLRCLLRSRQHRLLYAFYLSVGFAIVILYTGLPRLHRDSAAVFGENQAGFIVASLMMLCIAVVGLRIVVGIPLVLRANWIFRVTRIKAAGVYLKAARKAFVVLAIGPVWSTAAALMLFTAPPWRTAVHLASLACIGATLADVAIVSLRSVPFTCSYLPGKGKLHFVFWGGLLLGMPVVNAAGSLEWHLLATLSGSIILIVSVSIVSVLVRFWANARLTEASNIVFQEKHRSIYSA